MANSGLAGINRWIKFLPWAKITTPMIPVLVFEPLLWGWLSDLYQFNVTHNLTERFPTDDTFMAFFTCSIFILVVYLAVSVYHTVVNVSKL